MHGENILIACGTRPARSPDIPFDGKRIVDTDELSGMASLPKEIVVVGRGVVGLDYASFMAAVGAEVTSIDQRPAILDFVDREIVEAPAYHLRQMVTTFRLGERVARVGIHAQRDLVFADLESGKKVHGSLLLYAVGQQANGEELRPEAAGLQPDPRGKRPVNESFQTDVPHIYAAGDVMGFPALANTSMEQGRLASRHMFGQPSVPMPELFPYGIYTIPEISLVGQTEETLTAAKVPDETGVAKYAELAKSMMLGVPVIGQRATEIIHGGQAVLSHSGSIEYFRNTVFNYPALAEAYKVAALDGLNKL